MTIEKVGLWWNPSKNGTPEAALQLAGILAASGVSVCADAALAALIGMPDCTAGFGEYEGCDMLAVLGGDGTLLSGVDVSLRHDIPILGVNLGRKGFLSEIEPENMRSDINKLLSGNFSIEERMMLGASAPGIASGYALNDAVFSRTSNRTITLEVYSSGEFVDRYSGDGLIVASPTGSTAYSFSAGGPILAPGVEAIMLTPLCAHTISARPYILPSSAELTISNAGDVPARLSLDGRREVELGAGESAVIDRYARRVRFIRLSRLGFYSRLRSKLTEWNAN